MGAAHERPKARRMVDQNQDNQKAVERVVTGLAGAAFEGLETVEGGISALWNFNKSVLRSVGQATEPLRKPLDALGVTEMMQRPVEALTKGMEDTVTRLEEKGRAGLEQTGMLTIEAIGGTVDAVVAYLTQNPKVDALIAAQLEKLLPLLATHPAVEELVLKQVALALPKLKDDPAIQALIQAQATTYLNNLQSTVDPALQALIRQQGDTYIDYLNAHPTAVQSLVQGQSMSLANDVMNEVRERTVTADSMTEMLVRKLLGRKPRIDLSAPPEEVQRRAETSRLPSDFFVAAAPLEGPQNQPPRQLTAEQPPRSNGDA